jgi:hypothetical protein
VDGEACMSQMPPWYCLIIEDATLAYGFLQAEGEAPMKRHARGVQRT